MASLSLPPPSPWPLSHCPHPSTYLCLLARQKIHLDELQAVRERAKDGAALEHLAGQIRTTSG